jgi:hypothetical protein
MRIFNYSQIPSGRYGKGMSLSGLGDTLPITTLSTYNDTAGAIDSSGSNIEGLLNPTPVVTTTTTNSPSLTELLVIAGLGYGAYYYYKHYMNKGERVPRARTLVKELVVPMG